MPGVQVVGATAEGHDDGLVLPGPGLARGHRVRRAVERVLVAGDREPAGTSAPPLPLHVKVMKAIGPLVEMRTEANAGSRTDPALVCEVEPAWLVAVTVHAYVPGVVAVIELVAAPGIGRPFWVHEYVKPCGVW